jgi:hypothetical protein
MTQSTQTTSSINARLQAWIDDAKSRLASGTFSADDLSRLAEQLELSRPKVLRQRLLYLHAQTPSIGSGLIAATLHEPVKGGVSQMDPLQKDPTYQSVHEAIIDGWEVIHFPLQQAPIDDREIDILGYEFVLQKKEYFDA